MKKFIGFIIIILSATVANAQLSPVTWSFTAQKTADKTYEVHMRATIQQGWHLYSQTQPENAIAIPTSFTVNNNPLLTLNGKIKEVGKIEKFHDAKLDISANQYSNMVDFVQTVKLKAKAQTNLSGSVEFQTCDDKKCLPPKTVTFSVALK
jgi:DsbC/DsbD-like thiol-disulfide interchange protein